MDAVDVLRRPMFAKGDNGAGSMLGGGKDNVDARHLGIREKVRCNFARHNSEKCSLSFALINFTWDHAVRRHVLHNRERTT